MTYWDHGIVIAWFCAMITWCGDHVIERWPKSYGSHPEGRWLALEVTSQRCPTVNGLQLAGDCVLRVLCKSVLFVLLPDRENIDYVHLGVHYIMYNIIVNNSCFSCQLRLRRIVGKIKNIYTFHLRPSRLFWEFTLRWFKSLVKEFDILVWQLDYRV